MVEADEPTKQRRIAADDTEGDRRGESGSAGDPVMLEPTEAELDDWAARERKRRQAWVSGPTAEERAEWAQRERMRRLSHLSVEDREAVLAEWTRQMVRYPREMQLAAEGMISLIYQWSRRQMTEFVRAGRDWEDQFSRATRRGRVHIDEDDED
jgi:hypothetical protein